MDSRSVARETARPARVVFRSFGCKLNLYEASAMGEGAREAGFDLVTDPAAADTVVVNTCSVTMRADQETRQYLRSLHRDHPLARGAAGASGRTRAVLRVQDGCDAACTYCVIPRTRGRSTSLSFAEAVNEGRRLLAAGFREIVLSGTHLGHFGLDIAPRVRLSDLVESLTGLPAPQPWRLRLSSVEPQEIDAKLIELLADRPQLCPHVHLPLLSGSDPVLRSMRRAYRTGNYRRQVERIAARVPRLGLGADLMMGFPGETETDFRRTLGFLAELPFTHLHPFTYSPRPGTAATGFPGRPPGDMASRRLGQARSLVDHKNRAFRRGLLGATARVLVETGRNGVAAGWSDHYLRVEFPAPRDLTGSFALVRLDAITDHGMSGTPLDVLG